MLHLVIGRVGSGKSEKIYELLNGTVTDGGEAVFVVPEQYSFETEKNLVLKFGAVTANKISVYSFSFMARILLKQMGISYKTEIDDSTRAMIMSLALEETEDKLDLYSRAGYSSGFIRELLGIERESRQYGVVFEDVLLKNGEENDTVLKQKLKELSIISKAYNAIAQQSFLDGETALDLLHTNFSKTDCFKGKTVFIDGFRGFTPQELLIIEDILKAAKDVYVTVCTDKISGLNDKTGVFAHTKRTAAKLFRINDKGLNTPVDVIKTDYNNYFLNDEMKHLENNFYLPRPERFNGVPESIQLCSAEDFVAECDYIAMNIKRLISEENYRCREIAVISRDSSKYERQIKASLKKYGVPVYIDKRQPVANQPLIGIVLSALKTAEFGFETESIFRILKSGLTDFTNEEISILENYVNIWQINGSRWKSDFTGHPEGLGKAVTEESAQRLEEINRIRKAAVMPIIRFIKNVKDTDGTGLSEALFNLLSDYNADKNLRGFASQLIESKEFDLAENLDRVWDILMNILNSIGCTLGKRRITAKRYSQLFNVMVSEYSMGALPVGLDEVTVGSADRVRITAPKAVFIAGVCEGVFPYIRKNRQILSLSERERLRAFGINLGQNAQEEAMEERFISYNTFCGSQNLLFVSYPRKDIQGSDCSPSELYEQIKKIFPDVKQIDTVTTDKTEYIRSKESAFEVYASEFNSDSETEYALNEFFSKDEEYKGKLLSLKRAAQREPFMIQDEKIATELFRKNMYVSATRAEAYYSCPFMYFCRYGIKAEPLRFAELDTLQKGTIIHYVLESLIRDYGKDRLCGMDNTRLKEAVDTLLEDYFNEKIASQSEMTNRFIYSFKKLSDKIFSAVKRLIEEFSLSEFVPVDFELKIDNDGTVKPLEIKLKNGTLKIKGSVDRVDMMNAEDKSFVRVVDYKSGSKTFNLNDVFCGLNMQMLIYLFSIWKNGTGKYENAVPAGVLYMPVGSSVTALGRDATDEDIIKEQKKSLQMSGIVLDDTRVIEGMDISKSGTIIPVKYKDNKFTGSIIDISCLNSLYEKVEDNLRDMGDKLHNGEIEAYPVEKKCDYCDYKSICGFEKTDKTRSVTKMKFDDCIDMLRGGDENA